MSGWHILDMVDALMGWDCRAIIPSEEPDHPCGARLCFSSLSRMARRLVFSFTVRSSEFFTSFAIAWGQPGRVNRRSQVVALTRNR